MHPDEVPIDAALVRKLVGAQFPRWGALSLERVPFFGTDNAIYRLGDELAVRLPRREQNELQLTKECRWVPVLAPRLPVPVPRPVVLGDAGDGYPFRWGIYRWVPGEPATSGRVGDVARFARDLARFVGALHGLDASAGPRPGPHNVGRGQPLGRRDDATRRAIHALRDEIDADAVTRVWEDALAAPLWAAPPVWIHGDLDARNLLVADGRLSGVIDFGCLGVGDPSVDVMVAWKLPPEAREAFRDQLSVDDATWARSRGWTASQAVIALAYYTLETNPVLVHEAWMWLENVLNP